MKRWIGVAVAIFLVAMVPAIATAGVQAKLETWNLTGSINLRIPFSELNFPTNGSVPILTLTASRFSFQYGNGTLGAATWADSDWFSPQPMYGTRSSPDLQTVGSQLNSSSTTLYSLNYKLAPEDAQRAFFIGYGGASYGFRMADTVTCTIGCVGTFPTVVSNPFHDFSYNGP